MANFNLNKVILGGRLTSDVELKQTPSGVSVCTFTIAVNRKYQSEGQQQADFINCQAWRGTADFISKYFKKGSSLCIVGSVQTRSWQDQQGNKRHATEIVADEAMFVDSKSEDTPSAQNASQNQNFGAYSTPAPKFEDIKSDDDLPF
jgi:single-strand DNA-binding protein